MGFGSASDCFFLRQAKDARVPAIPSVLSFDIVFAPHVDASFASRFRFTIAGGAHMEWFALDWQEIFGLTVSPIELMLRGTLMYLGIFAAIRVLLPREAGAISLPDLIMVTLIADAAQ